MVRRERDVEAGVGEEPREPRPPRTTSDHYGGSHDLLRKSIATGTPSSPNRALADLREARQPPSRGGKRLNVLYGAQIRIRPPRFRIFVNDPGLVTRDYGYWVENELRERFGLEGVPVSIDFVRRS